MKIQEQPNRWSCMVAAFATATGIPYETLIEALGHDGSEIIFEDLEDPFKRRAFNNQELVHVLYEFGWIVATYEMIATSVISQEHHFEVEMDSELINKIMADSIGVIGGTVRSTGVRHAAAWDGQMCYDPTGFIYPLSHYQVEFYFLLYKSHLSLE